MKGARAAWVAVALIAMAIAPAALGSPISILCTTTIVGDVVRQVAGSDAIVSVLLPIGADPHAFAASPRDAIAIETANVVFLSGAGLETSLAPLLQSAGGRVIDLSIALPLRAHSEEHEGDARDHGSADPHVWFDPWNVIEWIRVVARTLGEMDSEHATAYDARAAAYEAELLGLDAWIRDRVGTLPPDARCLVTDHESFSYFAARYGFQQIGTVFPGTSTSAGPSARDRAALEDAIRAAGVPAIFVGTTVSSTLAEQVAADTGAQIVFLYTGSLSEPGGPAATYLDFMRCDVDRIVAALARTP